MTDLETAFDEARHAVDQNEVDQYLGEAIDPRELLMQLNGIVGETLTALADDELLNPALMRKTIDEIAMTAFLAGLAAGANNGADPHGVIVGLEQPVLEALALQAIRDGSLTFTLVAHDPEQ